MAKKQAKGLTANTSVGPVEIRWPLTLAGLSEAWGAVITPAQVRMEESRTSRDAYGTKKYSVVGGIAESKRKKIAESGLLGVVVEEQDEDNVAQLGSSSLRLAAAVLEAGSRAGISRMCDGHPETDRTKEGEIVPVVCYRCHAPSQWPGSPKQQAENVTAAQLKEWTRSALESIVLSLDALIAGKPNDADNYAQSAGIGTDKVLEGTVVREVAEEYIRHVRHQFCRLGYTLRDESVQEIGTRLQAGGLPKADLSEAITALAVSLPIHVMEKTDMPTLASLAYKLASALWSIRRRRQVA